MNIIDFTSIFPYLIFLLLSDYNISPLIKNIFCVFRIFLLFKITRFSYSLKSFARTLVNSGKEFGILIVYLSIGVVFFATFLYYCEKDVNDKFVSIPAAFWYLFGSYLVQTRTMSRDRLEQ